MIRVNIREAKTQFSRLLARVRDGEEVVIASAGKPVARLLPWEKEGKKRVGGQDRGQFQVPDDFDAPLPPEVIESFDS